jgi:hypothetical protein
VKVGRAAFDEDAIREIEEHNPDIEFDWTRILQAQPEPAREPVPDRRDRRSGRSERPNGRRAEDRARSVRTPPDQSSRPPRVAQPPEAVPAAAEPAEPAEPLGSAAPELDVPAEPEALAAGEASPAPSPALDRLGFEGLQRLRARHAEILARIADRGLPPEAQEELRLEAERLNPDAWVTADDVTRGLDEYEHVLSSLRAVVGQRRRRRRRGGRPQGESSGSGEQGTRDQDPAGGLDGDFQDGGDEESGSNDTGE